METIEGHTKDTKIVMNKSGSDRCGNAVDTELKNTDKKQWKEQPGKDRRKKLITRKEMHGSCGLTSCNVES